MIISEGRVRAVAVEDTNGDTVVVETIEDLKLLVVPLVLYDQSGSFLALE